MEDGEFLESGWFPRALVHVDVGCKFIDASPLTTTQTSLFATHTGFCSRCNRNNIEGLQDRIATEKVRARSRATAS